MRLSARPCKLAFTVEHDKLMDKKERDI